MRRILVVGSVLMMLAAPGRAQYPADAKHPVAPALEPPSAPVGPTEPELPGDAPLDIGDRAPDFELDSSLGRPLKLADIKGHWSVIVFSENASRLGPLEAVEDSIRAA